MNNLIKFINNQSHYKAGDELDIARNNTLIFGTYNPPKDLGYINNYRFSINNNKILKIIEASKDRVEDVNCITYKRCGGCNMRHIEYEETLIMKRNSVQALVNK